VLLKSGMVKRANLLFVADDFCHQVSFFACEPKKELRGHSHTMDSPLARQAQISINTFSQKTPGVNKEGARCQSQIICPEL